MIVDDDRCNDNAFLLLLFMMNTNICRGIYFQMIYLYVSFLVSCILVVLTARSARFFRRESLVVAAVALWHSNTAITNQPNQHQSTISVKEKNSTGTTFLDSRIWDPVEVPCSLFAILPVSHILRRMHLPPAARWQRNERRSSHRSSFPCQWYM